MTKGAALFTTFNGFEVTVGYLTICIVTAIIAILVIIFNALVVHTMVCHRNTKTISDCFLSCLAISDLIMGIMLLYITSYSILQYQIFSECLVRFGQSNGMFACSTFQRLAFTVDRFIKIILPLHYYKIFTKSSVVLISVFIWVISLLIGFLPLLGWRNELLDYEDGHLECRFFGVLTEGFLTLTLCLLTGATCVMVVLYVVIFYVARKQANSIAAQLQGFTSKSYLDKHSFKLAKTVSIVVGISNVCWLPTFFVVLLHLTGTLDNLSTFEKGEIITYCSTTVFLNSLINPVIYALKIAAVNSRFRYILATLRKLCCCQHNKHVHPRKAEIAVTKF